MNTRWILIATVLLLSGSTFADNDISWVFRTIDKSYKPRVETELTARSMPPIYDQSGFPICYAMAATTLLQQEYCRQRNEDCKLLPPDKRISPFEMVAGQYAINNRNALGLNFDRGGSPVAAANYLARDRGTIRTAACHNFEYIARKFPSPLEGFTDSQLTQIRGVLNKIREQYEIKKSGGEACISCVSSVLAEYFDVRLTDDQLKSAMAATSFERALYDIFLGSCNKTIIVSKTAERRVDAYKDAMAKGSSDSSSWKGGSVQGDTPSLHRFPAREQSAIDDILGLPHKERTELVLKHIKRVLAKNRPVGIEGCVAYKNNACIGDHAFVIGGYRKVCNTRGECIDSLQIINSWGQGWQDRYDNGWIDARYLLDNTWQSEALDKVAKNKPMLTSYEEFKLPSDERDQTAQALPKPALNTVATRFLVKGDTVKDMQTGLTWVSLPDEGKAAWDKAAAYCESRGAGWRLPTLEELTGLLGAEHPLVVSGFTYWLSGSFAETSRNRPCGELRDQQRFAMCPLHSQHRAMCVQRH